MQSAREVGCRLLVKNSKTERGTARNQSNYFMFFPQGSNRTASPHAAVLELLARVIAAQIGGHQLSTVKGSGASLQHS